MNIRRFAGCMAGIVVLLGVLAAFAAPCAHSTPLMPPASLKTPDGLWSWVRPLPFGYLAHAIATPSPGTLIVGTSEGDALVTHDGGVTWSWSPTNVTPGFFDGLSSLAFVSPQEGWAGGDGVLLHTSDGGKTWQTQLSQPDFIFTHVSFSDATSGWAVAEEVDLPRIFATSDAGRTWTQVSVPGDNTTFTDLVKQGPGQALLIQEQWQSGIGNGDDLGVRLWRTTDYGAHWSAPASPKGGAFLGTTFVSPDHGWAIIGQRLSESTDGGLSWRTSSLASATGLSLITSVGSDVWAVGNGHLLHSADGGATWHSQPGVPLAYPFAYPATIAFSDALNGWLMSGQSFLRTSDGGHTWHVVGEGPKTGVSALAAGAGGTVWGAADYVIRSTDGGATWRRATTQSHLISVAAQGTKQAWAAGTKGRVLHTGDGGRHWTKQPSGTMVDLQSAFFLDTRHGWIGGFKGVTLRTVDGGRHWVRGHVAGGGIIDNVTFADPSHGLALVAWSRPYVLVSANGGRTWSRSAQLPSNLHAKSAVMFSASHWLVISSGGRSWVTNDAGKTWQPGTDLPQLVDDFTSLARSGQSLCAISWSGQVATSTDSGATWSYAGLTPAGFGCCAQFVGDHTLLVGGGAGVLRRDLITAPLP